MPLPIEIQLHVCDNRLKQCIRKYVRNKFSLEKCRREIKMRSVLGICFYYEC